MIAVTYTSPPSFQTKATVVQPARENEAGLDISHWSKAQSATGHCRWRRVAEAPDWEKQVCCPGLPCGQESCTRKT